MHKRSRYIGAIATIIAIIAMNLPVSVQAAATTIYLTSGTSWVVPSDWNSSNNTIEVIGGGGGGGNVNNNSGSGGGGGAYSKAVNVSLTGGNTVTYAIGSGGGTNTAGGDTYICSSTSNCASIAGSAVVAGAKGGSAGAGATGSAGGAGGATANGVGSVKYAGGNGAASTASFAGGGGAAAGPHGVGGNASVSDGGTGTGPFAGVGAANSNPGSAGGNGSQWGPGIGSGGGGSGCNRGNAVNAVGGAGGSYGGGGGGGCQQPGGTGGAGVIVITYYPSTSSRLTIVTSKFELNLDVRGSVSKGSGTFVIDHPQDPARKILYHSFLESPDAKNIYDGIAKLDENGEVTIDLPDYFEVLNKDFRYQFFPLEEAMPNLFIKEKVKDNKFTIAGGVPHGTISWQVTGNRHDPYIKANPIRTEVLKGPKELVDKGECIFEPACAH